MSEINIPPMSAKTCLNCGESLTGNYCHKCGQAAHIHNSISHLLHELIHGILHFEAAAWRTLAALVIKPGKLTREYIKGRRRTYVSPLSLFLFLMIFALILFSLISQPDANPDEKTTIQVTHIRNLIVDLHLPVVNKDREEHFFKNPELALYKLKTSAFKLAFLLIPISLPFLWLLFVGQRRFSFFDHAVFSLYSLSFVTLLILLMLVIGRLGMPIHPIAIFVLVLIPHFFFHVRDTYELSLWGALWRTGLLLIITNVCLLVFLLIVLLIQISF